MTTIPKSTTKELIFDLEHQKKLVEKEIIDNQKAMNLLQIELTQRRYQHKILMEKKQKLSAEIYSQKIISKFR